MTDSQPPVGEGGTLEERDRESVRRMAERIVSEGRGHRYWTTPGNVFLLATEVARLTAELAEARYRPIGDNHHNAAACPYCRGALTSEGADHA